MQNPNTPKIAIYFPAACDFSQLIPIHHVLGVIVLIHLLDEGDWLWHWTTLTHHVGTSCGHHHVLRVILHLDEGDRDTELHRLTMLVQAVDIIMYLGLNCMFWMGPGWSLDRMAILAPVSVLQLCTLPSVDPAHTTGTHLHTQLFFFSLIIFSLKKKKLLCFCWTTFVPT